MLLGHYVKVIPMSNPPALPRYQVRYIVNHQSFDVGVTQDTLEEAVWYRDQLLTALQKMVGEVTDS